MFLEKREIIFPLSKKKQVQWWYVYNEALLIKNILVTE